MLNCTHLETHQLWLHEMVPLIAQPQILTHHHPPFLPYTSSSYWLDLQGYVYPITFHGL